MREGDKIQELWKEREYLSVQLEDATKELARLDLLNLTLTRQKRQAIAAFHLIKVMQEKIQRAFTIGELYFNVVKALTSELFMDSAAVLRINFETKDISLLASAGLPENLKCLKLYKNIAKQQLLNPTLVNSKSPLQSFHTFIRKSFKCPYFTWYPMADEEGGTLVLFVGNRVEDLVSKQPFSEESLETFGAISSVILLRRDNIAYTQEMLRKKEERIDFLAEILRSSPVSVIATDADAKIVYCNPAVEELYGYTGEELIGRDPGMLNAEPNAAEIQREVVDTVRAGKVWKGEILNRKKNGDLFYIRASIYKVLNSKGDFIALVGFHEDITGRKRDQERLREYEARYSHLLDHMPDGVALTQRRRIIRVNPPMARMFSYPSPESMEGLSLLDLASPGSEEIVRQQSTPRALGQQGENRFEFQGLCKDGSTFPAECTLTMDRGEAKSFLLAIIRDVTARKTFEEQRKLFSERIIVAQEKERALIARELHDELGQALTGIKMDMSWIKSHTKDQDEAVSARFEALGNLVDTTIESMRELAASLHPSVLDRLGLTTAIEWYAGEFERRTGIECMIESESSDFNIDSNAAINVYRIFQEALTNVARHARASRVDIRIAHNRGYLTICISDNGKGIPPQKFSEPMSLGIAGMRERAQLVKGRLDIQSRRGKGTKVTVYLPTSP